MTDFFDIAFTPSVLAIQEQKGSRDLYPAIADDEPTTPHQLSTQEAQMLATRDSFYMATVSETGWPYVQHRGGDAGFVKVLDDHTIGWVERSGNRQYLGTGNIAATGRVAAIFVDYPSRTRLKVYGEATYHPEPSADLLASLDAAGVRSDGAITVSVLATNWNCPKYITPRFTEDQVKNSIDLLQAQITDLKAELAACT